jgi:hypothetical protein
MGAGHLDKVVAEPNILTGSNLTALFEIQSTTSYTLQARIYTIAGEFLKLLKGQEGTNQVSWNASGLSSGTYIAVIELISPQGGVAGRQTLKVLVIH